MSSRACFSSIVEDLTLAVGLYGRVAYAFRVHTIT